MVRAGHTTLLHRLRRRGRPRAPAEDRSAAYRREASIRRSARDRDGRNTARSEVGSAEERSREAGAIRPLPAADQQRAPCVGRTGRTRGVEARVGVGVSGVGDTYHMPRSFPATLTRALLAAVALA